MNDFERFLKYVRKGRDDGGCWIWTGAIKKPDRRNGGYGIFNVKGRSIRAHKFSYEWFYGKVPDGKVILHSCDERRCVAPGHLVLGTASGNMEDAMKKGRLKNVFTSTYQPKRRKAANS
jgi:hypothetical protein